MNLTLPQTGQRTRALRLAIPFAVAMLLGAVVLYGVGFSPIAEAHNAAHDGRHSFAFPCH